MKTALVIEDNEDNLKLNTFILQKNGYRTMEAENGQEGIAMVSREKPDFIILDIQLPDIDGEEVLREIRMLESGGAIPVVAMTSFAMSGDRENNFQTTTPYICSFICPFNYIFT